MKKHSKKACKSCKQKTDDKKMPRKPKSGMMKKKMSAILAMLIVAASASIAEARYCNSPACQMCNRLFGPLAPVPQDTYISPVRHGRSQSIESTPQVVVDAMLKELNLTPDDVLYDIGCGDGRILISAVKKYGCKAVGIEIDPDVASIAFDNVRRAGCGRITIVTADATTVELNKATAVTMYLFTPLMEKLMPRIVTNRIVSYSHELPGISNRKITVAGKYNIYVMQPERVASWSWISGATK